MFTSPEQSTSPGMSCGIGAEDVVSGSVSVVVLTDGSVVMTGAAVVVSAGGTVPSAFSDMKNRLQESAFVIV